MGWSGSRNRRDPASPSGCLRSRTGRNRGALLTRTDKILGPLPSVWDVQRPLRKTPCESGIAASGSRLGGTARGSRPAMPVLVDASGLYPGTPLAPWPPADVGERPRLHPSTGQAVAAPARACHDGRHVLEGSELMTSRADSHTGRCSDLPARLAGIEPAAVLRRHLARVAMHGRMPPYEPFTCGDDRQMSVNVADGRAVLAPRLAPRTRTADVANSLDQSSHEWPFTEPCPVAQPIVSAGQSPSRSARSPRRSA